MIYRDIVRSTFEISVRKKEYGRLEVEKNSRILGSKGNQWRESFKQNRLNLGSEDSKIRLINH